MTLRSWLTRPSVRTIPPGVVLLLAGLLGIAASAYGRDYGAAGLRSGTPAIDQDRTVASITGYLSDWQPLTDPLITLPEGDQVKSSNVYGVEIDGVRYYYRPKYGFTADPVARNIVAAHETVAVLEPGTQWETEVYRVTKYR